jgi:hypothetical protein
VRHFTQRFARRMGRRIEAIPAAIMDALVSYPWPGNVRELQNVIERAVVLSPGPALQVSLGDLQSAVTQAPEPTPAAVTLAEAQLEHILGALRETGWVVAGPNGAAARLGMKRSTLQEKTRNLPAPDGHVVLDGEVQDQVHAERPVRQRPDSADFLAKERRRAQLGLQDADAAGVAHRRDEVRPSQVWSHRRSDDGVFNPQHAAEIRSHEHLEGWLLAFRPTRTRARSCRAQAGDGRFSHASKPLPVRISSARWWRPR